MMNPANGVQRTARPTDAPTLVGRVTPCAPPFLQGFNGAIFDGVLFWKASNFVRLFRASV
jgi:hypothetical protein